MIEIKEIHNAEEKSAICNSILRALPDWFGLEASIVDYVKQVASLPFVAAYDGDAAIGFVALKPHTQFASEVYVMGILAEYHRRGIGKQLIAACEGLCRKNKVDFLMVKTLAESRESKHYEKTRHFYLAQGFKPLEVFPTVWGEDNPCLLMIKCVLAMVE